MRVIFEEVDEEYFFEIILTENDLEQFQTLGGLIGDFVWEGDGIKDINVYIRKEKESEICLLLKEKKLVLAKDSPRTSKEKWKKAESPKSKPLRSLIAKRAGGKKPLPKRKQPRKK